jgi:hypothetical protein
MAVSPKSTYLPFENIDARDQAGLGARVFLAASILISSWAQYKTEIAI